IPYPLSCQSLPYPLSSSSHTSSVAPEMSKTADYYLPPIVRSLGEDVRVDKVRLQCKTLDDGRYLYTYTMDLAQDKPNQTSESGEKDQRSIVKVQRSAYAIFRHLRRQESETDYSVKSFRVRRPATKPALPEPIALTSSRSIRGLTDMTMRSDEEELSSGIRQEVTITFYLFGQTERGDYYRRRVFDAFLGHTSVRRVLRSFAALTDHSFKQFVDHLYILPGNGDQLKDATKWQKLPRNNITLTLGDLRYAGQELSSEMVLIVDMIGVRSLSSDVQRSIKHQ
ncbi:hypothetical protein PFISCL1PPCAC_26229, partial [Pristionchus fissidentatus]